MDVMPAPARSARGQLLDLACATSLYRVAGGSFGDLLQRARATARAAAREGVPLSAPLASLFMMQRDRHGGGEALGWHFRRAYGMAADIDALRYFTIACSGHVVAIASRSAAGAGGEIRLDVGSVAEIFACAAYATPGSYDRWADDAHPVGGAPQMLRMEAGRPRPGQLRLEAADLHPCDGSLYFGEPAQELDQVAAFCRLEPRVLALFAACSPTEGQRREAGRLASLIAARAGASCFFPCSGYCGACGGDMTQGVTNLAAAASETGCRLCGRSWCD